MDTALNGIAIAFKKLTGRTQTELKTVAKISTFKIPTPLGPMVAGSVDDGICLLEFEDKENLKQELAALEKRLKATIVTCESDHIKQLRTELDEYFRGSRKKFEVPLHTSGTAFQESAWKALKKIGYGQTRSYQQQAAAVGNPKAVRAVARANGENRIAIVIPCHRVIGSNGQLTGYSGGLERKKYLLTLEKS